MGLSGRLEIGEQKGCLRWLLPDTPSTASYKDLVKGKCRCWEPKGKLSLLGSLVGIELKPFNQTICPIPVTNRYFKIYKNQISSKVII